MVENLCTAYGEPICQLEEENDGVSDAEVVYSFPTVKALSSVNAAKMEKKLRALGFGYRAAYICKTAASLNDKGGEAFLKSLRNSDYTEAKTELLQFCGVGPKVAMLVK